VPDAAIAPVSTRCRCSWGFKRLCVDTYAVSVGVVLPLSPVLSRPVFWPQVVIVIIISKQPAAARALVWAGAQALWQVCLQPVTCRPLGWRVSRQGQLRGLQLTGLLLQQSSHLKQRLSTCSMTEIECRWQALPHGMRLSI
jgi:hypothetical protein